MVGAFLLQSVELTVYPKKPSFHTPFCTEHRPRITRTEGAAKQEFNEGKTSVNRTKKRRERAIEPPIDARLNWGAEFARQGRDEQGTG
jgi:hypothetical protein